VESANVKLASVMRVDTRDFMNVSMVRYSKPILAFWSIPTTNVS